jgi:hypothetical protein
MAAETPIAMAVIGRTPGGEVNAAAFLILMGVALCIESPVIDLLATSTTLTRDRDSFATITRFAGWLILLVTAVHALVAATPLYDVVVGPLLNLPPPVAEAVRGPLLVMIPWSGLIGWRRYLQGLLIRQGRTRAVGMGTGLRVATMAGVGFTLLALGMRNGLMIAAIALVSSVAAEAGYVHRVSRPVVGALNPGHEPRVTIGELMRFHLPLTATTLLALTTFPIIGAALARTPNAVSAMASWQVAMTLMWLHRTVTFALPEVVIALRSAEGLLYRFCVAVGSAMTALVFLFMATGVDRWFFASVLGADAAVVAGARQAYALVALAPLLSALQAYSRGILTLRRLTSARLWAVIAGMAALGASLGLGVAGGWPGLAVASSALVAALVAETAVLVWLRRRSEPINNVARSTYNHIQ